MRTADQAAKGTKGCRCTLLLFHVVVAKGKSGFKAGTQQQRLNTKMREVPPPPSSVWGNHTAPRCLGGLGATAECLRHSWKPCPDRVWGAESPSTASLQVCACEKAEIHCSQHCSLRVAEQWNNLGLSSSTAEEGDLLHPSPPCADFYSPGMRDPAETASAKHQIH